MDIGESIVGAYMRYIRECEVVVYNTSSTTRSCVIARARSTWWRSRLGTPGRFGYVR